jgi:signal transduction histidine kinase
METQSAFMAAAAACLLIVATLARRRDATALGFAGLVLLFGAWSAGRGARALGLPVAAEAETLALAAISPFALLFAAHLAGRSALARWVAPGLVLGGLTLAAVILLRGPDARALAIFSAGWAAAGATGGAVVLWRNRTPPEGADSPEATRLRYLAFCHLLVPAAIGADLAAYALGVPRVATPFAALLYLFASYLHLVRVRVVDLRQLTGSAIAISALAAVLAAFFAALWVWVGPRVDLFVFDAFLASFVLLMFAPAIRDRIRRMVERRLGSRKIELERALEPLRERLNQIHTLDELLRDFLATLERTDRVTASSVYLRNDPSMGFQQAASIGMPPRPRISLIRDPVFVAALEAGDALLEEDLDPGTTRTRPRSEHARLETLRDVLRRLDAQLILPLRTGTQLVGFWTLTDSGSTEAFSAAEIELLRDVAARAATSIENSKTFEQIRTRDRYASLGEMAAGLAHEIRNPLASIKGALAVLPPPAEAAMRELHDVILEETARLDRVVGMFLDYTQPTLQRAKLEDPGAFVRDCVEAIGRRCQRGSIQLQVEIDPELPVIAGDADQLEAILANLLRNAYEAIEGPGSIQVRVAAVSSENEAAEGVEIVFKDDGPGMEPATLDRALVPFFTTKERGTGLGLPLCERLIRAQGGSIELRSTPGRGTEVAIRLPAWDETDPEVA